MDRAHPRLLVAANLTAVPIALLMASLAAATSPSQPVGTKPDGNVVPAVLQESASDPASGHIRQVTGFPRPSQQTRPGLLQVMTGARSPGDRNHHHRNMEQQERRSLFGDLFRPDTPPEPGHGSHQRQAGQPQRHPHAERSGRPQQPPKPMTDGTVDWNGIPYHRPSGSPQETRTAQAPVRDPGAKPAPRRSSATPSQRPSASSEVVDRRDSRGGETGRAKNAADQSNGLADRGDSSEPLQIPKPPAELAAAPNVSKRISTTSSSRRPGRRDLSALESQVVSRGSEGSHSAESTEATGPPALIPRVAAEQTDSATERQGLESAGRAGTALVEMGVPTPRPPHEADDRQRVVEDAVASPADRVPDQPYAASTPSDPTIGSPVSHRSGPPLAAFQLQPIGSGVTGDRSDANDANESASEPAYRVATRDGSQTARSLDSSPKFSRMTTRGIPVSDGAHAGNRELDASLAAGQSSNAGAKLRPAVETAEPDDFDRAVDERHPRLATTKQMRGGPTSHVTSDALATTSELPGIRVVTHGPKEITLRQTSQFEVRVENRGSIDAEGVLIRATVPDWAELGGQEATVGNIDLRQQGSVRQLVWTLARLPAGTSERMFVRLTAARSGSYDWDVDWTLLPQKSVAKVQVHEPRLELRIEGPDEVVFGQSQTYQVHVLNPGDGTAPGVVFTLSPNSATPQTQHIGDIPAGKEAQFDLELTAKDLGDLKIQGLATAELGLRAEAAKTIRVASARLEAVLSGPEVKYQNTPATYSLQVQNSGSVASEKIIATLRLPAGVELLGGLDEAVPQGDTLSWEITALPPGGVRNYQFTCQMVTTGEHRLAFECRGTAAGQAAVWIGTRVESIADLVLTVNDPPAPAPIGSEVVYEIVILNRGSKAATDVRAVAQFSHGIEPRRIEGQSGEVVTGQVLFDPIVRIGAGQEVRLRVIAQADRGGHHRFRSEVRSGDTLLVAEEATHYMTRSSERVSRHSSEAAPR